MAWSSERPAFCLACLDSLLDVLAGNATLADDLAGDEYPVLYFAGSLFRKPVLVQVQSSYISGKRVRSVLTKFSKRSAENSKSHGIGFLALCRFASAMVHCP